MAIRSPGSRPLILPPYKPSAAQRDGYQGELNRLLREMSHDLITSLASPENEAPSIAMDALSFEQIARTFDRLNKKWIDAWFQRAPDIAAKAVTGVSAHADRQFAASLKRAGFAINFRPTPELSSKIGFAAQYNTSLIKSIGTQYLDQVANLVTQAALKGGDAATLAKNLRERYGVAKSRAALIARDQNAKITALVTNERRAESGLFYARWHHSAGVHEPRPDHLAAGLKGLIFDIRKGAYLERKWVQPGEEINCHCSSSTIIPSLEHIDPSIMQKLAA